MRDFDDRKSNPRGSTPTIAALASGNALIVVPEEVTAIESGEAATVMALDKRQP